MNNSFIPDDPIASDLDTIKRKIQDLKDSYESALLEERQGFVEEKDFLLMKLFRTQEELQQKLIENERVKRELRSSREYLQGLIVTSPLYLTICGLTVLQVEKHKDRLVLQWRVTDLYVGERHFSELRFKTVLNNGDTGLVIQRSPADDFQGPFIRWPSVFKDSDEIPFFTKSGLVNSAENMSFTSLGPTDWKTLQELVKTLIRYLSNPTKGLLHKNIRTSLLTGFLDLQRKLENWPAILRYDSISLERVVEQPPYRALEICLVNVTQGNEIWPSLTYYLASVDNASGEFGRHPRIEFQEKASNFFDSWFVESDDARGPRLEIRFSLPDDMDIPVWSKLVGLDQVRVISLISTLSLQLGELRHTDSRIFWTDWVKLSENIRRIVVNRVIESTVQRKLK